MANIQEGLMAAAPGGFGGAASGLGMALSANPIGAAVTGAGAVFSFLGARKARKERERSKQAALAALAPSGEEASIRSQLLAEPRRGAAGGLPPGLELLSRRQEALSGADVARRDEIADVEGRRRLGAVGLLGSGAGQATLGRAAAERARVRDALGLEREGRLFGASQAERGRGPTARPSSPAATEASAPPVAPSPAPASRASSRRRRRATQAASGTIRSSGRSPTTLSPK